MEDESMTSSPEAEGLNGDAPESDQAEQADGLLTQDKQELSERVTHLEKRVREQQDEIVCLKGAMADLMRRVGTVESAKKNVRQLPMRPNLPSALWAPSIEGRQSDSISVEAHNSVLPTKPYLTSPRRAPTGKERPSAPLSARQPPRGSSASSARKWNSMSSSIDDVSGQKISRSNSQLSSSNTKGPSKVDDDDTPRSLLRLKGRKISLFNYCETEPIDNPSAPSETLKLKWCYGYHGKDARNNLFELPTGEIIYFHAAVVVLYDVSEKTQRHYLGHTDDIRCLAIHPDKIRIASGQMAGHETEHGQRMKPHRMKPHVRLWDSVSLNTLGIFGEDYFQRSVICVSFDVQNNDRILAVDDANDHTLSVWDISDMDKAKRLMEAKSSRDPVTQCEFHPDLKDTIICCGKGQIGFWSMEGGLLDKKNGIFGKNDKPKFVICFAFTENKQVVTGDSSGNIYMWEEGSNKIETAVEAAHDGPVFSICVLKDGSILSGGGKDGKIIQWDANLQKMGKEVQVEEKYGPIRMISEGQGKIYVGTINNCILYSTIDLGELRPCVEGHKEELWGLCAIPDSHYFLTCGYDRHIYVWNAEDHSTVWMKKVKAIGHCCAVHRFGSTLVAVIGNRDGTFSLFDLSDIENGSLIKIYTVDKDDLPEQFECVEFSPDGAYVALGNRNNYIYVYEVKENGKKLSKLGRCKGHTSFVTHIDWDVKSQTIRSNSGDYSVLFWDAASCKQVSRGLKGIKFATNNCTLSFETHGIWPEGGDGTDVNNCSVSNDKRLLATADDFGKVKLFNYPSTAARAPNHEYKGHSSHVTMAKFLSDDSFVITTGGRDTAILQWEVC